MASSSPNSNARVSFSLERSSKNQEMVDVGDKACCKRHMRHFSRDDLDFPTSSLLACEESSLSDRIESSQTTSSSLSRHFHKARSFSCLDEAILGPHGASAKSLEKRCRPQKKKRRQTTESAGVGTGPKTGSFEMKNFFDIDVDNAIRLKSGVVKDFSCPIFSKEGTDLSLSVMHFNDHKYTGSNKKSSSEESSSFDELCKSFEGIPTISKDMYIRSSSSSGRSESSCVSHVEFSALEA